MPGLVPGIHDFQHAVQIVDGRDKPGHDEIQLGTASMIEGPERGGGYVRKAQRRLRKQFLEVGEAAGAAAGDRHHMQVEHDRRRVVGGALGQ